MSASCCFLDTITHKAKRRYTRLSGVLGRLQQSVAAIQPVGVKGFASRSSTLTALPAAAQKARASADDSSSLAHGKPLMCSYPVGRSGTSAALYWKFDSAGRFFASGRPHTAREQREYVLTCQDDAETSDVLYVIDDVSQSSRACRCAHREPIRTQRKSDRLQLSPTTLRQLSLSYFCFVLEFIV